MEMAYDFGEQLGNIRERLAAIERGQSDMTLRFEGQLKELVVRIDRQNGRVTDMERRQFSIDGKLVAQDSAVLHQVRESDSFTDWMKKLEGDVRGIACRACDPSWRSKIEDKLETLAKWRNQIGGGWVALGITAVVVLQAFNFVLALLKSAPHVVGK